MKKHLYVLYCIYNLINNKIKNMIKINCPKCGKKTTINIEKSISEDAEVFVCEHCGYPFRYVEH